MFVFHEILKDLITDSGLSLRELSRQTNISASHYSQYLHKGYPRLESAVKICNYFNCSLDYLFGLTETKLTKKYIDVDLNKFLPRYKTLLEENHTTHWKFCKKYNLSESNIRKWKKGEVPSMQSLIIIAYNLSSSIDFLVGRY